MKKNDNLTPFIIAGGIVVLVVFTVVLTINLLPNYESNSYYVKVEDEMGAKVEALDIKNNKLTITTSGDALKYCVKSTRTTPASSSICWKEIYNNNATISVYKNKRYYVWIKDSQGKVSSPMSINTKDSEEN